MAPANLLVLSQDVIGNTSLDFKDAFEKIKAWIVHVAQIIASSPFVENCKTQALAFADTVTRSIQEHPVLWTIILSLFCTIVLIFLAPQLLLLILKILGFIGAGIAKGSYAAAYQAAYLGGYIAKGSWFAVGQSAAMGGKIITILPWPITLLGIVLLGSAIALLVRIHEKDGVH